MVKSFFTIREAALEFAGTSSIKKLSTGGMQNCGLYLFKDRILKFSYSISEAKACTRLIGKKFNNVVKIYAVQKFLLPLENGKKTTVYAIEQERLQRKKGLNFYSLEIEDVILSGLKQSISVKETTSYIKQILNGYVELESVGVIYRDLHSSNVMSDVSGNLKIIDFGCVTVRR
jgi:serine/threonine protein kinase